ncbi:DUF21 domain-containing protein [bacterium]|nr:MAG: DUF21 domain-containing protein [bacterium]
MFSGSEVAYFSIKGAELEKLQKLAHTSKVYGTILQMLEHPRRLLSTILIGNTFTNIITSVVAAVLTGQLVHNFALPNWLIYTVEILVVTFTLVIISEITPKVIAIKQPLEFAHRFNWFVRTFYLLLAPISGIIARSTVLIESKLPKTIHDISSDDIRTLAEVGEEQGSLQEEEREIFENVIEFGQTTVKEIMTSRVDIVAVSTDDALGDVIELILNKKLSRMPLYGEDLDDIIGVIYAKDILPYLRTDLTSATINWRTLARKVLFVPTTKRLDDLLKDFKKEKTHLAVVVDEWGGTEGIVTLDDVLEEIIGDIADETTEQEQLYTQLDEHTFVFDAKINLEEVEEILEIEGVATPEDEYETLGGLVYHVLEKIPKAGDSFDYKGLSISVSSLENNRIKKIKVKRLSGEQVSTTEQ